ncbi:MAG: tRNA 2-selenouridine(34) synthase MnmH [Synechococcus sp.]
MSGMANVRRESIEVLRSLDGPVVDVRSPSEYAKGHWPGATNIPLFSDEERADVGTSYKQQGRQQAIQLGLSFTGPKLAALAAQLQATAQQGQSLRIYCWRGGLRSGSVAWLADLLELSPVVLEGGYKAYRHWAQSRFDQPWPIRLMGGRTGTGKTDLLLALQRRGIGIVDLEGLANHRGSSFGGLGLPAQPSTEHYENRLAEALQSLQEQNADEIWLEAESVQVGHCRIPKALFEQMTAAPVLEVQRSLDERVRQLVEVYGQQGAQGLSEATQRISRRLGPQRTKQALDAIAAADWDTACSAMLDYYDRCYDHELSRSPQRQSVDLSGLSADEAAGFLIERKLIPLSP